MDSGAEWLADLHKSQCFTTCEVSNPSKTSDFGADGYTASLSDWHELLQLTAPDDVCGLAFVRGQFPNTPGAILARAQRRDDTGSKGTFGTRLQRAQVDSGLEIGERRAQGWVNLRWPYSQHELTRKGAQGDEQIGTCEQISFVKGGTVFQLMRLKWGHGSSLSEYSDPVDSQEKQTLNLKLGGIIQFGCPCSNGRPSHVDTFKLRAINATGAGLNCMSERYQKRLEVHLFVNGVEQSIADPLNDVDGNEIRDTKVDITSVHDIELSFGDPTCIISTYTLRSASEEDDPVNEWLTEDFQDYLGISNSSVNMTDRLWTALCSTNYEASEAVEFCVIGRCVEQILCVCSIPFPAPSRSEPGSTYAHSTTRESLDDHQDAVETALLCNIITPQYVDVQSAFFQIRLLVKIYHFISTRYLDPDLLQRFRSLDSIRDIYLEKICQVIHSSLIWLINTDIKPSRLLLALRSSAQYIDLEDQPSERLQQCRTNRVGMIPDQSYNQACYATLAVWYVMKHCPDAITEDLKSKVLLPKLTRAYKSVQKRASRDKEPTPKNDVLQWLHLCCVFLICSRKMTIDEDGEDVDGFVASGLNRQNFLKTQQTFEKYVSRLKTNQIESFSSEQEELDRIILLGTELGLEMIPTPFTLSLAHSRAEETRQRITARKRTTSFNPGPKAWKGSRITSNGPWELLCINHQAFLRVADYSNVRAARDRLFEFMMSDYSLMTSWDRADSNMVGKWWDLEPISVVSATLVDLKMEGKLRAARSETAVIEEISQSIHDLQKSQIFPEEEEDTTLQGQTSVEQSIKDILLQIKQIQADSSREQLSQMRQLLAQEEMGGNLSVKAFDWMMCKPDQLFHPDWWVQSLEDTPEVYQAIQTRDVPLRRDIRRYLSSRDRRDVIENPGYSISNISQKIAAEDLQFLSLFELRLTSRFKVKGDEFSMSVLSETGSSANRPLKARNTLRSLNATLQRKASSSYSSSQLDFYRHALFGRLNDSLIDLGVKYRILFAEKCSPALVGSFIYMWHPDALDTVDNYFGAISRFSENREAMMWTTSITVSQIMPTTPTNRGSSSWSLRSTSLSQDHNERFNENRNNGDFPPTSIANLDFANKKRTKNESVAQVSIVEERSSSLVITGDPSGYHWICSVWSSLTDSDAVLQPIQSLPEILQCFIHQQACGRCLAFLVLLGHLCEKLAAEYEYILARLDVIVGLGEKVLLEGLEWGTSEAVDKLKKMLWGLEALRVFDDRLSGSLSQIQKAQEAMERVVKQEAGQQHIDLLQEYNNVIEEFEKRYGMLSDVKIRTQLKIRQVTGLRDGISTVTNVEDSQTALRDSKTTIRQGNNIRILTYITIAYLPLGFVTGLFSISHAPFMNSAGNIVFAILTVIFVLGTYALALSLESIISQWSRLRNEKWGVDGARASTSSRDDAESKLSFSALGSCCGLRRRHGSEVDEKIFQAA